VSRPILADLPRVRYKPRMSSKHCACEPGERKSKGCGSDRASQAITLLAVVHVYRDIHQQREHRKETLRASPTVCSSAADQICLPIDRARTASIVHGILDCHGTPAILRMYDGSETPSRLVSMTKSPYPTLVGLNLLVRRHPCNDPAALARITTTTT